MAAEVNDEMDMNRRKLERAQAAGYPVRVPHLIARGAACRLAGRVGGFVHRPREGEKVRIVPIGGGPPIEVRLAAIVEVVAL